MRIFFLAAQTPILRSIQKNTAFRAFLILRAADEIASQMLNLSIGWFLYSATHNPMSLAYAGFAQFLPNLCFSLFAGNAADRFDRRKIIRASMLMQAACVAAFSIQLFHKPSSTVWAYPLLVAIATARAFSYPAISAALPQLVSAEEFPRAVAASSTIFQICTLAGPAMGGMLYAYSHTGVFGIVAILHAMAALQTLRFPATNQTTALEEKDILGGIRYLGKNRLLLALLSLDLFAVLLGGATALLPIYAHDILHIGPMALGCLRSSPGIGAALTGILLSHHLAGRGAGKRMLLCVAGFGAATMVFALSRNFWLSLAALAIAGAFDMVSMVIRQTLIQTATPDSMRGRVSAINGIFIGASAELGEFESGATAALFGTVPAAFLGGLATLVIVGLWSRLFPELLCTDA